MQCTVRYLSPRYKCCAAGELVAGGGDEQQELSALPAACLQCPHCPQPRPAASVTREKCANTGPNRQSGEWRDRVTRWSHR